MRFLWVIIAAVVIAIRAIPPQPDAEAAPPPVRIVSLTDDESLAFVDELTTHPHWQIQVADAYFSCTDQGFLSVYTISEDEDVLWDERDMPPRRLSLTDGERATLRELGSLDPVPAGDEWHPDPWVVSIGDLHSGRVAYVIGARVDRESPAGRAVDEIFRAATDRYLAERAAWLGEIRVLDARGRSLALDDLDLHERVDLGDWALAQPVTTYRHDRAATILVGGHRVDVTTQDARPALWALQRLLR